MNQSSVENNTDEIFEFMVKHGRFYKNFDCEELRDYIDIHKKYGTIITLYNDSELYAVVRWNWLSWHTIYFIDVMIHPGYRGKGILKFLLNMIKQKYSSFKWFYYDRSKDGKSKGYAVREWLHV